MSIVRLDGDLPGVSQLAKDGTGGGVGPCGLCPAAAMLTDHCPALPCD